MMIVYLPIAFFKDWICNMLRKRSCKSVKGVTLNNESPAGLNSPLKCTVGTTEMELEGTLNRNDSDADFDFSAQEEGTPLVSCHKGDVNTLKLHKKELTSREIAAYGFYIAPIWFVTEVSSLSSFFWASIYSGLVVMTV